MGRVLKQPVTKEYLRKRFRKPGELLLKTTLQNYNKVRLFGSKIERNAEHIESFADYQISKNMKKYNVSSRHWNSDRAVDRGGA